MNASPADQRRLLDLAELDARMSQSDHARKNPPQAARVHDLMARRQELSQELARRLGTRDDLRTELSRIESDVAVVDARAARDADRLATSSNMKEAQGLESEIASLARRKSELEDAELEVMDRLEQADAAVVAQEALIAETNAEGALLSAEAKRVIAEATAAYDAASRDRAAIAGAVPADLLALYDRAAVRSSGAALLRRGTCEGCRMVLAGTDMQALRVAAEDAVVMCPECGTILVRTEESGLVGSAKPDA
ncbi:zinc ribbon domain-containing protein [Microbacterium rhizomatis]|uniref:DNA-binding protein n=1 Tax=Microbacterium rhizomatis TaxID=1631477 RepID=A0A5J5J691_9MICO|nr:C4-type zinc ribbon domain-containing protein [Microbacterium rhizomatis]KAA9110495.1 DNA-binding protein [Microbacterium rhizomatis]